MVGIDRLYRLRSVNWIVGVVTFLTGHIPGGKEARSYGNEKVHQDYLVDFG